MEFLQKYTDVLAKQEILHGFLYEHADNKKYLRRLLKQYIKLCDEILSLTNDSEDVIKQRIYKVELDNKEVLEALVKLYGKE